MEEKLSDAELIKRLAEAAEQVTVGAIYIHYKDKPYKVLSLAIIEENNEIGVIYQMQYASRLTFIRPLSNWLETVSWQGRTVNRFTER